MHSTTNSAPATDAVTFRLPADQAEAFRNVANRRGLTEGQLLQRMLELQETPAEEDRELRLRSFEGAVEERLYRQKPLSKGGAFSACCRMGTFSPGGQD